MDSHDGNGTAQAMTPKLLLDALVRKNLENILHQGYGKFIVSYFQESLLDRILEATLEISKEVLKLNVVSPDGSINTEHSFHSSFSVGFPRLILHLSDCRRLIIILDEYKPKITLHTLSRTSRDVIVMCLRVFSIENYLLHSKALENISNGTPAYGDIELALELEEVLSELNFLASENSELKTERFRYKKELIDMEKEMQNTIEAYQTLLDCNNIDQKSEINEEIKKVKDELNEAIANKHKTRTKLREKSKEIKQLKSQISEIKESQQNLV